MDFKDKFTAVSAVKRKQARNGALLLSLHPYLSTALRMCAIQEFLSSLELV